mmetsp:Transcript_6677/g.6982  ORF Transcript_6677/g.6982 Transcript_6677/m.6982 type:complete len:230 (+) Transcript_6677:61-750(+)
MSGPPPPPRNKNKGLSSSSEQIQSNNNNNNNPTGSGYNVARQRNSTDVYDNYENYKNFQDDNFPQSLIEQIPETTLGMNVVVRGELEFETLLRIDGSFSGRLVSKGNLIVGPQGKITGNIIDMNSVLIDGKVIGDIVVQRLCLRGQASVFGSITCRSLQIDPTVIVVGGLNVHPNAPKVIDSEGKIIAENLSSINNNNPTPSGGRKSSSVSTTSPNLNNNTNNNGVQLE